MLLTHFTTPEATHLERKQLMCALEIPPEETKSKKGTSYKNQDYPRAVLMIVPDNSVVNNSTGRLNSFRLGIWALGLRAPWLRARRAFTVATWEFPKLITLFLGSSK